MAVFELDYKALMRALDRDLLYSVIIAEEDFSRFKRSLSQAKVRMAIEGKLHFDSQPSKLTEGAILVDITLVPKANKAIKVYQVNPKRGSFEL